MPGAPHNQYFYGMSMLKLNDALNDMIAGNKRLKQGLQVAKIDTEWEKIMGKAIALYTKKLEIRNRKLFITTEIGALKNELSFQKAQIIKLVNEHFKESVIDEVVIY